MRDLQKKPKTKNHTKSHPLLNIALIIEPTFTFLMVLEQELLNDYGGRVLLEDISKLME